MNAGHGCFVIEHSFQAVLLSVLGFLSSPYIGAQSVCVAGQRAKYLKIFWKDFRRRHLEVVNSADENWSLFMSIRC
jgi:hypothetical protein